ncbi:S-adenosylmethionine-dependent methyltransferase [Oceanobacillus oncorhynchi subsp. incaldanensis]|uniref:class I SAM-dependent DNA methyltransferase n=1 Tax=Oceanobacillus oncorhynchi TaxID=545501 RepID=UPI001B1E7EA1|nr:class I SAM-dependent methyltransferase [Oceanobacillus oncorhynchi]GIO20639.1 S-adenosylmethionine-dependent methyltransferase [Oceanobacillus oncorhynchi subsp. incaldanensis]
MEENVFNRMAKKYDTEERIELATVIADEIKKSIAEKQYHSILDYGGGTGLVAFQLADRFEKGWIVDASEEMIQVAQAKIEQQQLKHFKAMECNLAEEDNLDVYADIIILSLVLLHVPDIETLLQKLSTRLNPNGILIIADFDKNEKIQHPKVHNGFTEAEINQALNHAGLRDTEMHTFHHHGSNIFMNQDASLFIATGKK